jgi:3-hydroxyacyl-[acyl-carrier-protein] dehydratase
MAAPPPPSPADILARVQLILRRDLKLAPDSPIPPDMPFNGSDLDLDSLDILLLVTSIEKEFGVKIPSSEVGQAIFENVATLTDYVAKHVGDSPATAAPAPARAAAADPLAQLPHAEPFRFVSALTSAKPGESAEGTWNVTGSEDFFRGHFPGNPIVPGVLISEALAQLSGIAGTSGGDGGDDSGAGGAGAGSGKSGVLAHVDVRFEKPVAPPATIALRSKLIATIGQLQKFDVLALVNNAVVASGSITLHRSS